jgi:hypothetical protein
MKAGIRLNKIERPRTKTRQLPIKFTTEIEKLTTEFEVAISLLIAMMASSHHSRKEIPMQSNVRAPGTSPTNVQKMLSEHVSSELQDEVPKNVEKALLVDGPLFRRLFSACPDAFVS